VHVVHEVNAVEKTDILQSYVKVMGMCFYKF